MDPTPDGDDRAVLDARVRTMLPEEYQDTYESVEPTPMRSAGLKYDAEGQVAWDQMWGSFCDLAMAGGPPHKGTLLGPGAPSAIAADRTRYDEVCGEVARGIRVVTSLAAGPSPVPGWVRVECLGEGMAGWLLRAITMENVAARAEGRALDLPAGPAFRVEKEIRNVVTVASKTCHYWLDHMSFGQQRAIAALVGAMDAEAPLLVPDAGALVPQGLASAIERSTRLRVADVCAGWLGLECPSVHAAIRMMRTLVACNVLSRREGTTLYVPLDGTRDPDGRAVAAAVARVHRHAR